MLANINCLRRAPQSLVIKPKVFLLTKPTNDGEVLFIPSGYKTSNTEWTFKFCFLPFFFRLSNPPNGKIYFLRLEEQWKISAKDFEYPQIRSHYIYIHFMLKMFLIRDRNGQTLSVRNVNFLIIFFNWENFLSKFNFRIFFRTRASAFLAVKVFHYFLFSSSRICLVHERVSLFLSGIYVGKKIIFFYCVFGGDFNMSLRVDRV